MQPKIQIISSKRIFCKFSSEHFLKQHLICILLTTLQKKKKARVFVYVEVTHLIENKLSRFHSTPATTRIDVSKHPQLLK